MFKRYDTTNVFAIGEQNTSANLTPRFRNFDTISRAPWHFHGEIRRLEDKIRKRALISYFHERWLESIWILTYCSIKILETTFRILKEFQPFDAELKFMAF